MMTLLNAGLGYTVNKFVNHMAPVLAEKLLLSPGKWTGSSESLTFFSYPNCTPDDSNNTSILIRSTILR